MGRAKGGAAKEGLAHGDSCFHLRMRLHNAGASEEQADAIARALEALSAQIQSLVIGQRIQIGLLLVLTAAILSRASGP
jgi:ATP-dependent protease ClpP protease subunit